jgi:hypothetical protein
MPHFQREQLRRKIDPCPVDAPKMVGPRPAITRNNNETADNSQTGVIIGTDPRIVKVFA